jgi:multiple sugar transport system ATP-binding protein
LRNDLRLELKHIQQDLGATMLYVTHDQVEALTLASRIGVLDRGELVQLGSPKQVYEDPISVNVASRLGSPRINIVSRSVFPFITAPENVVTLGIRAEHIHLQKNYVDSLSQMQCQVKRIERLSDQYLVHLGVVGSEHDVIASVPPGVQFEPGDVIGATMNQIFWFDINGQRVK